MSEAAVPRADLLRTDTLYGVDADAMIDEEHRRQLESLASPMARLRRARRDPVGTARRAAARLRR